MNVFEILGPVMVGPSSSHTAGAVRIGLMTRKLLAQRPVEAVIGMYGSFAATGRGHGTDKALVAGLLSGVFSSPCSTPVLVALLSIASVSGSVWISAFLLLCYSVGYSILSIVAGTFAGFVTKLSSSSAYGKAGKAVSIILAIALLMLSFYLFYQAF